MVLDCRFSLFWRLVMNISKLRAATVTLWSELTNLVWKWHYSYSKQQLVHPTRPWASKSIGLVKDILKLLAKTSILLRTSFKFRPRRSKDTQESSKRHPRRRRNKLNVMMSATLVSTLSFHSFFTTWRYLQWTPNPYKSSKTMMFVQFWWSFCNITPSLRWRSYIIRSTWHRCNFKNH